MTGDDAALLAALPVGAFAFVLVMARIGAAISLLPGLGEAEPPMMLRIGLSLGVTVLLLPGIAPLIPPVPEAGIRAAFMVAAEVITGLWIGWLARLVVLALPVAGQIVPTCWGSQMCCSLIPYWAARRRRSPGCSGLQRRSLS